MLSEAAPEETLQLTVTVPGIVARFIHEQVASGIYASAEEYVESRLLSEALFEPIHEDDLTRWINTEGVRRLLAMEADPSSALTIDEAFAVLDEDEKSEAGH